MSGGFDAQDERRWITFDAPVDSDGAPDSVEGWRWSIRVAAAIAQARAACDLAVLVAAAVDRLGLDRFDTRRAAENAATAAEARLLREGRVPTQLVVELADGTRGATQQDAVRLAREVRYLRGAA